MLHETQTAASAIRRAMGVMLALAATSCGSDAPETPNETSTITIESTLTTVPTTTSIAPQPTTTATTASSIPELATTAPTTEPTTTTAEPTSTTETADTTTTVAVNGPEEGATGSSDRAIQPQSADNPFGDNFDLAPLPDPLPGRPDWYGKRPLAMGDDGIAIAQPTPPELENRAFPTIDRLPPPITDDFYADVREVPDAIVARSTWTADCPVTLDELRYVRVSHWGFEGKVHTGEFPGTHLPKTYKSGFDRRARPLPRQQHAHLNGGNPAVLSHLHVERSQLIAPALADPAQGGERHFCGEHWRASQVVSGGSDQRLRIARRIQLRRL